jgi:4-hydroxybenzoate polyprenyltransferase
VIFLWSWSTIIACMIAGKGFPPIMPTLMILVAAVLVTASVYIYNDLVDADMDSMNENKTGRPLANGSVSKVSAKLFILVTGVVGLWLSYLVSLPSFALCLSWYVVFFLYSLPYVRFKKMFIIKEVTSSSGQIFTTLMGGFAVSSTFNLSVVFAGLVFWLFTFLGVPAFADTLDAKEDAAFGVKTLGRALGWKRKVQMMGLGVLFVMTVMPLTYAQLGFNVLLPISTVVLSLVFLRWGIMPLMTTYDTSLVLRGRRMFTIYLLATQIILIIGTLNLSFLPF